MWKNNIASGYRISRRELQCIYHQRKLIIENLYGHRAQALFQWEEESTCINMSRSVNWILRYLDPGPCPVELNDSDSHAHLNLGNYCYGAIYPKWGQSMKWGTFSMCWGKTRTYFTLWQRKEDIRDTKSPLKVWGIHLLLLLMPLYDLLRSGLSGLYITMKTRSFRYDCKVVERDGRSLGLRDMNSEWKTPLFYVALDKLLISWELQLPRWQYRDDYIGSLYIIELFWELGRHRV